MNISNLLLLLAMQKMLKPKAQTQEEKHEEYQQMAIQNRMAGGKESDLNPMLQFFVQNPTGSDTGPSQMRQEQFQAAASADPFLGVFQQALLQQ